MDLQLIKTYCEHRPGGVRQLAEDAKMSEANLHRCIRLNKIQASDLEKLATLLNVHIGVFFSEDAQIHVETHDHSQAAGRDIYNGSDRMEVARLKEKVAYLEQRLKDKEATIAEKENRIKDKDELIKILRKS